MLRVQPDGQDDSCLLNDIGERVMQIQYDAEKLNGDARDQQVIDALKSLEASYNE
ncbi:MAG: hypothetical protein GY802_21685 [Gammaproteobacteria bacterium]|nr:hypothetical protein [Gammaproteobacteria bacterium]